MSSSDLESRNRELNTELDRVLDENKRLNKIVERLTHQQHMHNVDFRELYKICNKGYLASSSSSSSSLSSSSSDRANKETSEGHESNRVDVENEVNNQSELIEARFRIEQLEREKTQLRSTVATLHLELAQSNRFEEQHNSS